MLKLYYARQSCALSVHLALEEFNFNYEIILIKLRAKEHLTDWFKKINPAQRVPVLVTSQGSISETPAILNYIYLLFNKEKFCDVDYFVFSKMTSFNCWLSSTMHVAHAHNIRGERWASSELAINEMALKTKKNMEDCCLFIEEYISNNSFLSNDNYSICNSYLFVMSYYAITDGVDIKRYPKLYEHWKFVLNRSATKRILELHHIDLDSNLYQ